MILQTPWPTQSFKPGILSTLPGLFVYFLHEVGLEVCSGLGASLPPGPGQRGLGQCSEVTFLSFQQAAAAAFRNRKPPFHHALEHRVTVLVLPSVIGPCPGPSTGQPGLSPLCPATASCRFYIMATGLILCPFLLSPATFWPLVLTREPQRQARHWVQRCQCSWPNGQWNG